MENDDEIPRCSCGRDAELVGGIVIYPNRGDLHDRNFWLCRPCNAYVGCVKGSTYTLGTLAGPKLRMLRIKAHAAIDPIWKSAPFPKKARIDVYAWMCWKLDASQDEMHVGRAGEALCGWIIETLQGMTYEQIQKDLKQ